DAREPTQILAEHWVPLVRHRARAFLACGKALFGLAHFTALPVTDVGREALDAGGEQRHRREEARVAIARDDLRGHRFWREAEARERAFLERGREVRVGADRARDLADRDFLTRALQAELAALDLSEVAREHDTERHRL